MLIIIKNFDFKTNLILYNSKFKWLIYSFYKITNKKSYI